MNRKLIDHLLKSGVASSSKMQAALSAHRARGGDVFDHLLRHGVEEVALARAIGAFHGLKVVDLGRIKPKADALNRVNRNFCDRYHVLPFAVDRSSGETLWRREFEGAPQLHLEDVSAIPFVSLVDGIEEYQHRARVRAPRQRRCVTHHEPAPVPASSVCVQPGARAEDRGASRAVRR